MGRHLHSRIETLLLMTGIALEYIGHAKTQIILSTRLRKGCWTARTITLFGEAGSESIALGIWRR